MSVQERDTRIKNLTLTNFCLFGTLLIDFHPDLTVLIARNSTGKTAVLHALAIALEPFTATLSQDTFRGIQPHDVRRIRDADGGMEPLLPAEVRVEAQLRDRPVRWSLVRDTLRPRTKGYRAEPLAGLLICSDSYYQDVVDFAKKQNDSAPLLPVIGFYSTGRLWSIDNGNVRPKVRREDTSRLRGYADCLDGSASFGAFAQWFEDFTRESQRERESGIDSPHRPALRLQAVRRAVEQILAPVGWSRLEWDFVQKVVVAEHPTHGRLPVSWLSDGIKSVLAMVADIAHRCARLNPHLGAEAALLTPGIVLIDEVDMHLHPGWQQTILGSLRRAFPLLQLIVTTHSPHVLSTVPREQIRLIRVDERGIGRADIPLGMSYGEPSGDVLQAVMGVDPQPPVPERADLHRLTELVDQGVYDTSEVDALFVRLNATIGPSHPQLQRLQRSARRQEMLRKLA